MNDQHSSENRTMDSDSLPAVDKDTSSFVAYSRTETTFAPTILPVGITQISPNGINDDVVRSNVLKFTGFHDFAHDCHIIYFCYRIVICSHRFHPLTRHIAGRRRHLSSRRPMSNRLPIAKFHRRPPWPLLHCKMTIVM